MNNKITTLAEFLNVEVTEITQDEYNENMFTCNDEEYIVLTDDEADTEFYNYQVELFEDMGIQLYSEWVQEYILDNFVDSEWFNDAMKESYTYYCDDIKNESASCDEYENRLQEEMAENNCNNVEEYIEYMCGYYENGIEWYISEFGKESFSKIAKDNDLFEIDNIIEWLQREDGRSCLAFYDGIENELNGYYIYRTN